MIPVPKITVGVHPIDVVAHPTYAPGFRWCVMVGQPSGWADLESCVQAGWCPDRNEAAYQGEVAGSAACEAMRRLGIPCEWGGTKFLEHDPIPSEADFKSLVSYPI